MKMRSGFVSNSSSCSFIINSELYFHITGDLQNLESSIIINKLSNEKTRNIEIKSNEQSISIINSSNDETDVFPKYTTKISTTDVNELLCEITIKAYAHEKEVNLVDILKLSQKMMNDLKMFYNDIGNVTDVVFSTDVECEGDGWDGGDPMGFGSNFNGVTDLCTGCLKVDKKCLNVKNCEIEYPKKWEDIGKIELWQVLNNLLIKED